MNMTMENFEEIDFDVDEFEEIPEGSSTNTNLETNPTPAPATEEGTESQDDLTSEVLKLKGISDINKIKFEDESGAIVERSWDSLSRDEQINILTQSELESSDLSNDEIELLNHIRSTGMSVNDYLNQISQPALPLKESYKIDDLSDEDVYALDLLDKVGSENITDEELTQAVEDAKKNDALFKKTVEGLRKEYIRLLKDQEAQQANEEALQQKLAYDKFAASITQLIGGLNSFAGQDLQLSDLDKNELAEFMLKLDDSGTSAFGRALQDPSLFTKAAFWLLNEDEIVGELTKLMLTSYLRGYENAKRDLSNEKRVVFQPKTNQSKNDTFIDDDDWL